MCFTFLFCLLKSFLFSCVLNTLHSCTAPRAPLVPSRATPSRVGVSARGQCRAPVRGDGNDAVLIVESGLFNSGRAVWTRTRERIAGLLQPLAYVNTARAGAPMQTLFRQRIRWVRLLLWHSRQNAALLPTQALGCAI